jgi:hypothetical protein
MRKTLSDRISSKIRFAHDLSPNGTPGCIVWTGGLNAPGGDCVNRQLTVSTLNPC